MEIDYERIEQNVNAYGKQILKLIKEDYENVLSDAQKEYLKNILNDPNFIKVNKPTPEDIAFFSKQEGIEKEEDFSQDYVPSAHGGRTKQDDKIHIYPYTKAYAKCQSNDEVISLVKKDIIVHEIFHYFIRPEVKREEDFGHFLTEGLVQDQAEKFSKKHNLQQPKSNYSENVLAVQNIYAGLPDDWSEEKKDKLVFQGSLEELIFNSKEGKKELQEFKKNKVFKDNIISFIQESTSLLGMNKAQSQKIVSYYKKITNKSEVVSSLYHNLNEYFKSNIQQKEYFLNKLRIIAPAEYQQINTMINNSLQEIREQKVDLMLQKEQLQAKKQENIQQSSNLQNTNNLTRTLKNNGYISSIICIITTIISGIMLAFLLKG